MMLSKCKHENLVSLLHFCVEGNERILVYEYASCGSLDRYLSDTTLSWTQRIKICIGDARGLNYLHDPKKTQQRVIHRDIKSSNIFLDEEWIAKVSDFGLSKVGPANQPQTYLVSNVAVTDDREVWSGDGMVRGAATKRDRWLNIDWCPYVRPLHYTDDPEVWRGDGTVGVQLLNRIDG
ncbi:putative serine/threonine/dual specificity protein kinase, catalytic domain-containing protein [Tanacetum coccineum]|uniref:Serine/threonine/dual specificity protein kinase, catalytic domain-containing protein n=1 Tax=Tanacetum coccineum TaxID=301880 RepID=A0ABQ5CSI7_9ASTR